MLLSDINDYYGTFVESYNSGDMQQATLSLMSEIGKILVRKREDFINLLNESGITATNEMSDATLVNLYIDNVDKNKKLVLGTSLLVAMHNKQLGFDGEEEINDDAVKAGYGAMREYFFNAQGAAADPVTAIAQALGAGANLGTKLTEAKIKKKYGALDALQKKQDAKAAITQQLIAAKQAQIESDTKKGERADKTKRTLLIVGGVIAGIAVLGVVLMSIRKK
jgi:hypothetical protein